jgi:Cu-processing system permease protein
MTAAPRTVAKVVGYEVRDVARSRWLIAYTLFFLLVTDALLRFSDDRGKALLSLTSVVLIIIPLVTVVFATMYVYRARAFIELLLAQPVSRRRLFAGLYLGLSLPLSGGFVAGVALPFLGHGLAASDQRITLLSLVAIGVILTLIFTALAFVIALRIEDAVKGLGVAIALWLGTAVLYDGLVLMAAVMFAQYPLERPMLALMMANPVDLARVLLLLRFDVAALMGYTGAVFEHFFGGARGAIIAGGALLAWTALPLAAGVHAFRRKDF